jgi:four helix bundle protein
VSVTSNIAEGNGRASRKDNANFLSTSRGSLHEAMSLIYVSERLDFIPPGQATHVLEMSEEVGRMLGGLRRSMLAKVEAQRKAPTNRTLVDRPGRD